MVVINFKTYQKFINISNCNVKRTCKYLPTVRICKSSFSMGKVFLSHELKIWNRRNGEVLCCEKPFLFKRKRSIEAK